MESSDCFYKFFSSDLGIAVFLPQVQAAVQRSHGWKNCSVGFD